MARTASDQRRGASCGRRRGGAAGPAVMVTAHGCRLAGARERAIPRGLLLHRPRGPRRVRKGLDPGLRPLTEAIRSLEAAPVAEAYRVLRPLIALAWREIGRPNRSFDQALDLAISHLLATPTPAEEVELVSRGAVWAFKDPALESASAAQKQLLRMGPDNGRVVKEKLRKLARALKLPSGA
ncbi:MAG: DUF3014 domain-containing protein [Myxococcaceae bacterium]